MLDETAVRRAGADDLPRVAEVLAQAFGDDAAWAHVVPEDGRAERLLAYFRYEVNHLPSGHQAWISEDGSGAAVWAEPGRWRVSLLHALRSGPAMAGVFGRRLPLATRFQWRAERLHPDAEAHWYLHHLGVVPELQGRGLGAMLMRPVLERCDREALPAYLEASSPRNRALYERNGFSLNGEFEVPGGGPVVARMWREPREP